MPWFLNGRHASVEEKEEKKEHEEKEENVQVVLESGRLVELDTGEWRVYEWNVHLAGCWVQWCWCHRCGGWSYVFIVARVFCGGCK